MFSGDRGKGALGTYESILAFERAVYLVWKCCGFNRITANNKDYKDFSFLENMFQNQSFESARNNQWF